MEIVIRKMRILHRSQYLKQLITTGVPEPVIPDCAPWKTLYELKKEKEVVGVYISGHPLDDFKVEIKNFSNSTLKEPSES